MKRLSFIGVFAVALALCAFYPQPASAAVTGSFSTTSPNPYTGPCPVNISFTGSINGPAGTNVTYIFARFVNNTPIDSALVNATIPANGILPITETVSVDQAHSGFQSNALIITVPASADNSKAKVFFTVNCGSASHNVLNPGMRPLVRPVVTLHSVKWSWRNYIYKWVGISTYVPENGTGPCTDLCLGWVHIHNGDSAFLYHYNSFTRAFLVFDNSVKKLHVTKATLTLTVNSGDPGCLGGIGHALGHWATVSTHNFNGPYPVDGDFSMPTSMQVGAGNVTFDVTSIAQAWAGGKLLNDGLVIRGRVEDNGSDANDSCSVELGNDGVLTVEQ